MKESYDAIDIIIITEHEHGVSHYVIKRFSQFGI